MLTRSPGFSSTGPEVIFTPTPISEESSIASVVLPSPGGPWKSRWSSASPRLRAAAIAIESVSRTFAWPMKSASRRGRRDSSAAPSPESSWGVVTS